MERELESDREVSEELIKKCWGGLSRILNQTGAPTFPKTLSIRAKWVRTMKIWDWSGQKIHQNTDGHCWLSADQPKLASPVLSAGQGVV